MKGPQLAVMIWLANLLVLAGGAFVGYSFYTGIVSDRTDVYAKVSEPKTKEKRVTWQETVDAAPTADHTYYRDVLLSPQSRPDAVSVSPSDSTLVKETTLTARGGAGTPTYTWSIQGAAPAGVSLSAKTGKTTVLKFSKTTPQDSKVTVRAAIANTEERAEATYTLNFSEVIDPVPSDAELQAELQKWINSQFTCLRLFYGPESIASAVVTSKEAGGVTLLFRPGLKFVQEFKSSLDDKVKKLAQYDLTVVSIEWDHVVMNGPSRNPKYKDKYFDVKLSPDPKSFEKPDVNRLGKTGKISENKIKLPDETPPPPSFEEVDPRPKESVYDSTTDTWTLGTDDYKNVNVDDLAKYAKVVHDRDGNPLGIQISDDIPDDNSVIARGGRKGDIIKAINGQKVASMSDVRRIVRTEYNNGVGEFVVTYERDGVPGTKIFKAPPKKK